MEMTKLYVYLNENAITQLEDNFVDKEDDALRKFLFGFVRGLAKYAKLATVTKKSFDVTVIDKDKQKEDGGNPPKQETIKIKDIDLEAYTLPNNAEWRPKDADEDDIKQVSITVGPKTIKFLKIYGQIFQAKCELYNADLDQTVKGFDKETEIAKPAECIEQIVHEQLIGPVMDNIARSIEEDFDNEFEEANNPDKKKKAGRTGNKKEETPKVETEAITS